MFKTIFAIGLIGLLSACSSMSGKSMSSSDSRTSTMGASAVVTPGGPWGTSSGGPN